MLFFLAIAFGALTALALPLTIAQLAVRTIQLHCLSEEHKELKKVLSESEKSRQKLAGALLTSCKCHRPKQEHNQYVA